MAKSGIDYCDEAMNPIDHDNCHCPDVGDNCWGKVMRRRFPQINPHPDVNGVGWYPERLKAISVEGKSKVFFICNLSDIGHESVDPEYIREIIHYITGVSHKRRELAHGDHTYLFLTKYPARLYDVLNHPEVSLSWIRDGQNIHFGTTITGFDQQLDEERLDGLRRFAPYYPLWLSIEPLLKTVTESLQNYISCTSLGTLNAIQQVIVGGETGPKARLEDWRHLVDIIKLCESANVACFVKQIHVNGKLEKDINKWPPEFRKRELIWTA